MFDEIMDLFDRNRRERRNGSRSGFLSRIFGGGEDDDRGRRHDDDDDASSGRDRDRARRRRESDYGFDD